MNKEIYEWIVQFNERRRDILSVAIFTAVNLFLQIIKANMYFLFSATIPQLAFAWGIYFSSYYSNAYIVGVIIAITVTSIYFACWHFSSKYLFLYLLATVLFGIDCIVLVLFLFNIQFDSTFIIDILFHCWIMFCLSKGLSVYFKLRKISPSEISFALASAEVVENYTEEIADDVEREKGNSEVLRLASKKGRVLIACEYQGLEISMKRFTRRTELVVNDEVYAELKGFMENSYYLSAQVNDIEIRGECDMSKVVYGVMRIYINGEVIASKKRFY